MSGYTKLFNSILASTIWREDDKTRIVWITMLAMADRYGIVEGSVPGLADFARVSVEDCRAALVKLAAPDPDSRSQNHEGRRIIAVEGGWQILNHDTYRRKLSADERREYQRQKQREYRQTAKTTVTDVDSVSTNVINVSAGLTVLTHTEAEAEAAPDPEAQAEGTLAKQIRARGIATARVYLHRWQLESLIATLGPHAADFGLDTWIDGLSALADRQGVVLPRDKVWPWVQAELASEVQRRGLPVASTTPAESPPTNKRIAGLIKGGEAFLRMSGGEP